MVEWTHEDEDIPKGASIIGANLQIPQVRADDAGVYVCTTENVMTSEEQSLRVMLVVREN